MMRRIQESLIFDNVVVWDNSARTDWKTAGRYMAAMISETDVCFFQDDDVIVPEVTQRALLAAYKPGVMVANWGHGVDPDGYDDLPLVCGGAIVDRDLPLRAMGRYLADQPLDEGFLYDCDFAIGVLYEQVEHLHLPFEINYAVAQHESRLVNQPWQKTLKLEVTERARAIRDRELVAA